MRELINDREIGFFQSEATDKKAFGSLMDPHTKKLNDHIPSIELGLSDAMGGKLIYATEDLKAN